MAQSLGNELAVQNPSPISGPVTEVANILASQFQAGYQYNSLNAYRSAISSVHDKGDFD